MKRKILVTALSLFAAVAMAFGLFACNTKTSEYNDFGDVDSGGTEELPEGNSDSKYDDSRDGSDGSQSGDESEGEGSGGSGESGNTPGMTYTNELRYSLNDDKVSYSVTGYGENFGGDVEIPEMYESFPVTSIAASAFYNCTTLTSVVLSNSITSVGVSAFNGCTSLKSVWISDSVTLIGSNAFMDCRALEEIHYNAISVSDLPSNNYVFYDAGADGDGIAVTIGMNVEGIPSYLFCPYSNSHSPKITSVFFADNGMCRNIGGSAFRGCDLLSDIVIPNSVSYIGTAAFYNCTSLVSMSVPFAGSGDLVDAYFGYIFGAPNYSTQVLYIPSSLTDVTVTGNVTVKEYAFYGCTSLINVTIGEKVTNIGSSAFSGCSSLESLTLPFAGERAAASAASASTLFGYIFGTSSYSGSSAVEQLYSDTLYETYYIPTSLTSVTITSTDVLPGAFNNCGKIPSITLGDGVTSVGDYAFYGCASLTDVSISDSMVSVGDAAFGYCTSLLTISIPKSVETLGKGLFAYCTSLKHVEFLNDGLDISEGMFYCCESLEDLSLPGSVAEIGSYAYYGCTGLLSITVSGNAVVIGPYAFSDCTSLVAVVLDGTVSEIGEYAFYNCSSLASVTICDGVDSIGSHAFCDCVSVTSITVPTSVTTIGDSAFSGCSSLESMTLPFVGGDATAASASASSLFGYIFGTGSYDGGAKTEQLYSIMSSSAVTYYIPVKLTSVTITGGDILFGSFYTCIYLKTVTIEGGVATTIGSRAFLNCTSLASVTVGGSVASIESSAFSGCTSLTGVYITDIATWCSINFENETSNPLYYAGNLYLNGNLATDYLVIPDSVTSVGAYAFYGYTFCTSVTVPDSLTHIGINAFYGCTSVSSVYITDVSAWCSIDFGNYYSNPMYYAKTLYLNGDIISGEIVISDGVTTIGTYAFYNCDEILSIKIPDSVKTIGDYAFYGCSSLASVTIPNGVTSIGDYAFCNCVSFASITIPDNVTSIGSSAFSGCSSIESMTLPFVGGSATDTKASKSTLFGYIFGTDSYNGGVKTQQSYSSSSVTYYIPAKLTSVTITGGNILYGAFYNCTKLKYVTVGDLVTSVGQRAFYNCSSIISVVIGSGVTSIGSAAFNGCSSLESMILPFVGESATATSASSSTLFGYIFGTDSYDGGVKTRQLYSNVDGSYRYYYIPAKLTSVTIVGGNILYGAFWNCSSITSITIGEGLTKIPDYAFYSCTSLTSITIPDSVTSIGIFALYDCTELTSVMIGSGVTSIGNSAFNNCISLTSVYFLGTSSEWSEISIGSSNSSLTDKATIYYYSETEPTEDGNFWYYEDGEIVVW